MKSHEIERKVTIENREASSSSSDSEGDTPAAEPEDNPAPSILGSFFGLISPRGFSPSPSSRTMEEKQRDEIRRYRAEIRALKKSLKAKEAELSTRIEEINSEREAHRLERERIASIPEPPIYSELHDSPVSIHTAPLIEDKTVVENSISEPENTMLSESAPEDSMRSTFSNESYRALEETVANQNEVITALNSEILQLKTQLEREKAENINTDAMNRAIAESAINRERKARVEAEQAAQVSATRLTAYQLARIAREQAEEKKIADEREIERQQVIIRQRAELEKLEAAFAKSQIDKHGF